MTDLLSSDVLGILIQTVGAIIVAVISKWGISKVRTEKAPPGPNNQKKYRDYFGWVVAGVAATITFILIGFAYSVFTPEPMVEISSPRVGERIEIEIADTGSGSFVVRGGSERVANNSDLRVILLVHPSNPFGAGWWIQAPVVMNGNGSWSGQAWIGDSETPPQIDDTLDILAIVVDPTQAQNPIRVDDPKDLDPKAQSNVVSVTIGTMK